ncbi:MAG: LysR family transcriptional regulator [Janthinobacterium lividum]
MPHPSLQALDVFLAVARTGSFRRVAAERGITPSALSHLIRGLEKTLGVRLFHRTSRSIALTEAGRHLQASIVHPFAELDEALRSVGDFRDRPAGLLRLNAPRILNQLLFEPIVAPFHALYPEIRLEITSSDGLVDIVADGFDAGIRRDRRLAPGMVAVPIGPVRRFAVVGAPAYFARHPPPAEPADLARHACIERRFPNGSRYAWEFARDGAGFEVEVSGPLTVDDTSLMLRAALDGVGLAFMFESLVAEHVASGRLIRVLADWCPPLPQFFLFYPGRRHVPAPLRALISFVQSRDR